MYVVCVNVHIAAFISSCIRYNHLHSPRCCACIHYRHSLCIFSGLCMLRKVGCYKTYDLRCTRKRLIYRIGVLFAIEQGCNFPPFEQEYDFVPFGQRHNFPRDNLLDRPCRAANVLSNNVSYQKCVLWQVVGQQT